MIKAQWYKVPSKDRPMMEKHLKGIGCTYGKTFEDENNRSWFTIQFDEDLPKAILAKFRLIDYERLDDR